METKDRRDLSPIEEELRAYRRRRWPDSLSDEEVAELEALEERRWLRYADSPAEWEAITGGDM